MMTTHNAPQFYLIGAPKCGTSSLFNYLNNHTGVFPLEIKEPAYFAFDMPNLRVTPDIERYRALYDGAGDLLCGDYSTAYFHSDVAVTEILKHNPAAKFIVSLRDPAGFMISLFNQQKLSLNEAAPDFATAWADSDRRAMDVAYQQSRRHPLATVYKEAGKLGDHLARLMAIIPPTQLHVIIFDDLKANPRQVYVHLLRFLDLPDDGRQDFAVSAPARAARSGFIATLLSSRGPLGGAKRLIKRTFRIEHSTLMKKVHGLNQVEAEAAPVAVSVKRDVQLYFDDQVTILEGLLKRDLSHWRAHKG